MKVFYRKDLIPIPGFCVGSFHIDSVRINNGITQVFVREPLPFRQEADGSFNMTTFPFYHLPGPHEVSIDYLESSSN